MAAKISNRNKKYLRLILLISSLIILSGIIAPILTEKEEKDWGKTVIDKVDYVSSSIENSFSIKTDRLISAAANLKHDLRSQFSKRPQDRTQLFVLLNGERYKNYSIQIYDASDKLISWNSEPVLENVEAGKLKSLTGQSFFINQKLITSLAFTDTIKADDQNLRMIVSFGVQKLYSLNQKFDSQTNTADSLSALLFTKIEINYSASAPISRDGRKYSFPILNNYKNKIGVATFDKPALEVEISLFQKKILLIQNSLFLILFIIAGFWLRFYIHRFEKRVYRFASLAGSLIALRYMLFIFEIPASFIHGSINDPSNFSSVFAFGLVRSPLEFLITILFLLIIVLSGYTHTADYFTETKRKDDSFGIKSAAISVILIFIYLLSLRGLGAAIRSVIFDSTIRYFKEFALIPSPPILLMNFNILVLGFCSILFSVILLLFISRHLNFSGNKKSVRNIILLFMVFQAAGGLFDTLQREPQGTPLIRIIYITITFILLYLVISAGKKKGFIFVLYAVAASIVSVILLTFYNSRIERESLKTTAHELTRTNPELVEFMVFQTLVKIQQNERAIGSFYENKNLSAEAFILWTESQIYREGIPSAINFYDQNKKFAGGYQTGRIVPFGTIQERLAGIPDSIRIFREADLYSNKMNITGIAPIKESEETIGYAVVSAVYDENFVSVEKLTKIFTRMRGGISSAVDFTKLKIFNFQNGELIHTYGDANLTPEAQTNILNAVFSSYSESWMNMEINNEDYLFYILKMGSTEKTRILAVAVEEKKFSWNLSDFFKVFFVHTVIIITLIMIFAAAGFKKTKTVLASYRTRLIGAFLLISLLPLIIIALYFRQITEEKNSQLIEKRLSEMSDQVEFYLDQYTNSKSLDPFLVFEKAAQDLNINYSVYADTGLIYSSQEIYNEVGLLRSTINPSAYLHCVLQKGKRISSVEEIDEVTVNSVYSLAGLNGSNIILRVDDLFNKVSVPLSDLELDIFLFGVFSLAVLLLFILSTLLANQISSPIRKLTMATKSVGSGDLNVEVNYKTAGEIQDLVDGFNMMVKKIEQSQFEIAQMERESAWKEMAKQVAHEIKNPLTPMKLNVQQLIAAYRDKSPKFDLIFEKVTTTIISQIETLKNIAGEFSSFARMPRLNIEKLNAAAVIKELLNLFADEKRVIKFESRLEKIIIFADQDQLKRTVINLIRNSLQARANRIVISLDIADGMFVMKVSDDGIGIDPENILRVFDENFTTKKRGMGIGLSMAKKFIEGIGGTISIIKSSGEGTDFLIKLPLAE